MATFLNLPSGMGADIDGLPSKKNLDGILVNAADSGRNSNTVQDTLTLLQYVKFHNPDAIVALDSGGYELLKSLEKNTRCIYDPKGPIYSKDTFNITAEHLIQVALQIQPDILITLDRPVPRVKDYPEGLFKWLEAHSYNVLIAIKTVELYEKYCGGLNLKKLVPIQTYDVLSQFNIFIKDISSIINRIDGFSLPFRNLNPTKLAIFLLKFYQMGMRNMVHVLGIGSFGMLTVAGFAAKNWFDMVTCDSTSWRKFAQIEGYLQPHNLICTRLREDIPVDRNVLMAPLECGCSWCKSYKNLAEIRILPYQEKTIFLASHNFWTINQFCKDVFRHADSPYALYQYLLVRTKGTRTKEIEDIYTCLSKLDLIKDTLSDKGVSALWRSMCE